MTDISKCAGDGCEKKETCFRFLAESSDEWQSWITPKDPANCGMYWEVKSKSVVRRMNIQNED